MPRKKLHHANKKKPWAIRPLQIIPKSRGMTIPEWETTLDNLMPDSSHYLIITEWQTFKILPNELPQEFWQALGNIMLVSKLESLRKNPRFTGRLGAIAWMIELCKKIELHQNQKKQNAILECHQLKYVRL